MRKMLLCLAALAPGLGAVATSYGAVLTNVSEPFEGQVFVPCVNGEQGEVVDLTGRLHVLVNATLDSAGGAHVAVQFQPQGVSGIGETTGDKYQGTGVTRANVNVKVGAELTLVNNFRIIGQGPGNNFLVHEAFHITALADGSTIAVHDKFTIDCK